MDAERSQRQRAGTGRVRRRTVLVAVVAALAVFAAGVLVARPFLTSWALKKTRVRLAGVKIVGPAGASRGAGGGLVAVGREVLEGILGTITDTDQPPDAETAHVALVLVVHNPTPIDLNVQSLDFVLTLNGKRTASGGFGPERRTAIPARGEAELEAPLKFSTGGAASGFLRAVAAMDLEYTVDGRVEVDCALGRSTVPYRIEGSDPRILR